MIVLESDAVLGKCKVRFESRELDLFREVLLAYPMQKTFLQEPHHKFRNTLEASLRATRAQNTDAARHFRQAGALTIDKDFKESWDLALNAADIEHLLQILNDVRVGLWIQLGRPHPDQDNPPPKTEAAMRAQMLIHFCGEWQYVLIHAFEPSGE